MLAVMGICCGCSKRDDAGTPSATPPPRHVSPLVEVAADVPESVTSTNKALTQATKSRANQVNLPLVVRFADGDFDRFIAEDLIQRHSKARIALLESTHLMDTSEVTSNDLPAILSELSKVTGFSFGREPCSAVRYGRFAIASIGGVKNEEYCRAFLIRIPSNGWMFLETQEVPPPLRTPEK